MINKIEMESMKSIASMSIDIKNFNLFLGTNSSGKSTILQSLLILAQAQRLNVNELPKPLNILNGPLVSLGHFEEVKSKSTKTGIKITATGNNFKDFVEISEDEVRIEGDELYKKIKYLGANRIGALDVYPESFSDSQDFDPSGSYLFSYLQNNKKMVLQENIVLNQDGSNTLLVELNFWLRKILQTELQIKDIDQTGIVQITYDVKGNRISNRPKNLGTGTSFIISILILCLASKEGDIIIIENPELHLHPKAQSVLTEFLIHIAKSGRQLFIETHSDHVFNAVRVAVALDNSSEKMETKNLFGVNFIELNENSESINHEIEIAGKGNINNPQKDLFDQFDNDLLRMLGF